MFHPMGTCTWDLSHNLPIQLPLGQSLKGILKYIAQAKNMRGQNFLTSIISLYKHTWFLCYVSWIKNKYQKLKIVVTTQKEQ